MAIRDITPRLLGSFSVGLGLVQLAAPQALGRFIGLRPGPTTTVLMRLIGVRELAAGTGMLIRSRSAGWLWARVAGDAMDLALLSGALLSGAHQRQRLSATIAAVSGVTVADVQSAQQLSHGDGAISFIKALTVNRPPEDVYRFWRDFRHFPTFMSHLESVTVSSDTRSHWRASGPAGRSVEWDAEITADRPNELIAWRSLAGADVDNRGTVRFAPGPAGRGTEVRVEMTYTPPAGQLGATLARLFAQEPRQQVQADLRRLKQVLETGSVVRSDATLEGTHVFQSAAQPRSEAQHNGLSGEAVGERMSTGRLG